MRTFILAVTGVTRHRIGAMSLIASAIAVILSCSGLVPTGLSIESVTVTLTATKPLVGQTLSAVAILRDPSGLKVDGPAVTWSLSNPNVASIASSGSTAQITTIAAGTTEVTATAEGHSGGAALDVVAPQSAPVASTSVELAASSLNPGQSTQATATMRDASNNVLSGRFVSWSSNNTGAATVSASGLVTAVALGTAAITATSEGQSGSATISVVSTPVPPPAAVASVTVALGAASRNPGQTTQATATTRDANGNVLTGRAISWGSSNTGVATVAASGLVTAVAAGTAQITATSEGQSGSAALTVNSPPPPPAPVASVTVSLNDISLDAGLTTQATATTRDANGNILTGRAISWGSNNLAAATVSASGLVTAVAAGTAQITATSEGQSGSATFTVTTPPPPPPPGSSNEPAGMTLLKERAFNSLTEDPSWDNFGNLSIVQDATAPKSPSSVIRVTYPAGYIAGSAPGYSQTTFSGVKTLYITWWGKMSANFYGHTGSGFTKEMYAWTSDGVPTMYFAVEGSGAGSLSPWILLQGSAGNQNLSPNLVPNALVPRAQWFHIEVVLVGNTAGAANGTVDWWLDGVHVGSRTGVRFTTGAALWNEVELDPVYGGDGPQPVPATMTLDWDHVYVSGKNN